LATDGAGKGRDKLPDAREYNNHSADKKPAEARFRDCESKRLKTIKETDTIPEILGKHLSLFWVKRSIEKVTTFFRKGRELATNTVLLTNTLLIR
jgi:hypothetical protein